MFDSVFLLAPARQPPVHTVVADYGVEGNGHTEQQCQTQWIMEQGLDGAERLRVGVYRFQLIEHFINVLEGFGALGTEVSATGNVGNLGQGFLIQIGRRVQAPCANAGAQQPRGHDKLGTHTNGVDFQAFLGGQFGGLQGLDFAGAVLAKILVLVFIILFIQKRPRGLFALKGRAVDA